ncbi:hypothetical protein B0H14DRAFT_2761195 [Mycena olivaceomarginata]|nr:hypothetical protein B0H14DRAFT_2761195 [Mycena olivaceomarginata]
MRFKFILNFAALAASVSAASLLPPLYQKIPTGAIKPLGWALNQAQIQADGLAGHLRDFDSYVAGSIWVEGGSIEYSEMHESAPYWFNGMVALAFQLENKRLIGQVREFLDWTLDHQGEDGWLGPEPFVANATIPRLPWPRYLLLMGLVQYAEADPTQAPRILDAMHKFLSLINTIWKNNQQGDPSLGFQFDYQFVRWEELVYSLQWLVDTDPRDKEDELIETMQLARNTGFSWKNDWFTPATFPKVATTVFTMQTHGVNTAEALKSEALAFRFTGDPTDKQNTFDRLDMLYQYHGRASGTFSADEHIAGLNPSRGEQIFSLALIYQQFGNNSVAYNALPAGILHDWSAHQYDQQVNQIWAQVIDPPPWGNNGPNAYPKFWSHAFFADPSANAVIHAFLGPFSFASTLSNSNNVQVTVDTLYPFGNTLTYSISATKPFSFKIRVPTWAQNSNASTIAVNRARAATLTTDALDLHTVKVNAGKTVVHVNLHTPLEVEVRTNGAVAITRGALNFAVELTTTLQLLPFDNHTHDSTLLPTGNWSIAIDPSTIVVSDKSATTKEIPYYAWAPGSSPVTLTATGCLIEWGLTLGTASAPPVSPNACLVPFAAAKLRLGEVPVIKA